METKIEQVRIDLADRNRYMRKFFDEKADGFDDVHMSLMESKRAVTDALPEKIRTVVRGRLHGYPVPARTDGQRIQMSCLPEGKAGHRKTGITTAGGNHEKKITGQRF